MLYGSVAVRLAVRAKNRMVRSVTRIYIKSVANDQKFVMNFKLGINKTLKWKAVLAHASGGIREYTLFSEEVY